MTDAATYEQCFAVPLPPPQNPNFVENDELTDDLYPDPPCVPAGWVHIRSDSGIPSITGFREDYTNVRPPPGGEGFGGGEGSGSSSQRALAYAMRSTGRAARMAAERAGPGLGAAIDGARSGASWAAESMRDFGERHRVADRTKSAASSAARAVKDLGGKKKGGREAEKKSSAGRLKKGLSVATIEMTRRS